MRSAILGVMLELGFNVPSVLGEVYKKLILTFFPTGAEQ